MVGVYSLHPLSSSWLRLWKEKIHVQRNIFKGYASEYNDEAVMNILCKLGHRTAQITSQFRWNYDCVPVLLADSLFCLCVCVLACMCVLFYTFSTLSTIFMLLAKWGKRVLCPHKGRNMILCVCVDCLNPMLWTHVLDLSHENPLVDALVMHNGGHGGTN